MYSEACKKCESTNLIIRPNKKNPNHTELVCADCGTWQKFLNKEDIRLFEMHQKENKPIKSPMTLEEAIQHCKDVASRNNLNKECKQEHLQLAKWLKTLRGYERMIKEGKEK